MPATPGRPARSIIARLGGYVFAALAAVGAAYFGYPVPAEAEEDGVEPTGARFESDRAGWPARRASVPDDDRDLPRIWG
ncbi:MAG TPA: hypothetical protein VF163_09920 [Micromonosporaceae bacterium]